MNKDSLGLLVKTAPLDLLYDMLFCLPIKSCACVVIEMVENVWRSPDALGLSEREVMTLLYTRLCSNNI